MEPGLTCVITTIQEPTASVLGIMRALSRRSPAGKLIAIGDQKGPRQFDLPNADFYSLDRQRELPFSLAGLLPTKHYARKNLGYLIAMKEGAPVIYETDDDNAPLDAWKPLPRTAQAIRIGGQRWFNVYRLFSDELIWPRGMPLDRVRDAGTYSYDASTKATAIDSPIHQGLADLAPDVDAVWRLILDHDFTFRPGPSILLDPGTWCPFNSQNTWWWPAAYQLMYLPSYCSFRMTDIWRSFIAQRCLWETGAGVVFHQADVEQQRNAHNLMRDFMDEVPGYEGNQRLIDVLRETKLQGGPANVGANMRRCYEVLIDAKFFPQDELKLVNAWLADCDAIDRAG